MSNIFVVSIRGKSYVKGTKEAVQKVIEKYNLTNYLLMTLDAFNSTRLSDKKNKEKVMIEWNWNKLPKEAYPKVIEYIEQQKFNSLLKIHDDYNLSLNQFCCGEMVRRDMYNSFLWRHMKGLFNENAADEE